MTCRRIGNAIVCTQPEYKPGDQAPEGYMAWHEWAKAQYKAGLRQKQCRKCGIWKFPQELSDDPTAICIDCKEKSNRFDGKKIPRSKAAGDKVVFSTNRGDG